MFPPSLWEETFFLSPLRIRLSELPQVKGFSSIWEQEIETKLQDFQARLGWLIDPLLVPVALEVVISHRRPAARTPCMTSTTSCEITCFREWSPS
jgi:hypothetical protein